MKVTVTRDKEGDIVIWDTNQKDKIIPAGHDYCLSLDLKLDKVSGLRVELSLFKFLFGFTPRKGSKKVYELVLDKVEK